MNIIKAAPAVAIDAVFVTTLAVVSIPKSIASAKDKLTMKALDYFTK